MPAARLFAVTAALLAAGCGGKDSPREPTYPVTGAVTAKGAPAVEVRLTAVPAGRPEVGEFEALTDDKGEYRFGSHSAAAGLPPGKYDVRVTWPDVIRRSDPEREIDRLRGRYNDPKKPAFTIEVKEGTNAVPAFDLK